MKEAELYQPQPGGKVKCLACARNCQVSEGQIGLCGIRQNVGGKLQLLSYGKLFTGHIDPIEKKPVSHYHPGTKIFSISTSGCSWLCRYCFSADTRIMTDKGIVQIQQLFNSGRVVEKQEGEEVAEVEHIKALTHKGRLQNIEAVFKHRYRGEMVTIVPRCMPRFTCTPNHKILMARDGASIPEMARADQLSKGCYLAIPRFPMDDETLASEETIDLLEASLESLNERGRNLGPALSRRETRRSIAEDFKGSEFFRFGAAKHQGIPRYIKLDERLAWLLGVYCARGSVVENTNPTESCVLIFSFGKHQEEPIAKTQDLLNELFLEPCVAVTRGEVTRLQVGNTALAGAFRGLAGADYYSKKVPAQIMLSSNPKTIRSFVSGYLAGDGYYTVRKKPNYGVVGSSSVSRELTLGVAYCLLRLESIPRISTSVAKGSAMVSLMGRSVKKYSDNLMRMLVESRDLDADVAEWEELANLAVVTEDYLLIPIARIERSEYDGYVYNLQVAEDHTYTASFFAVSNCQNFEISQRRKVEGMDIGPEEVPRLAMAQGCQGIAYTYNEPTIFIEFARDIGNEAHKKGLFNIFVSNGFATPESVGMMSQFLDCITVDFKGSGEKEFVRKYIGIPGSEPILSTLLEIKKKTKIHTEITDLIVPQVGDSLEAARKLCAWIYDNLGPNTPVHFLRFHPDYKMMEFPMTPVKTLEEHHRVAKEEGLRYAYIGNVPGHPLEHTYCAGCNKIVVKRYSFDILGWYLDRDNRCTFCGEKVPIEGGLAKTVSEARYLPAYF